MPLSLETPSAYKLILGYFWSILVVFAILYLFDLHFAYDGDLMFWVIAAYVAPAGFVIEAIDQGFSIGLAVTRAARRLDSLVNSTEQAGQNNRMTDSAYIPSAQKGFIPKDVAEIDCLAQASRTRMME